MTAGTDIAGVVGTWVAVFLALVALVGIAGPLLVWLATLTDRHQALNATKGSGEFISKGIRVGSNIRLFRLISAPLLKSGPRVGAMNLVLDRTASRASDASTGWVQLSLVLRAHGFDYHCGDSLVIEDKQTWLPVNRAWILWLGIIGAFGNRADQGKLSMRSLHTHFVNLQAIPGTRAGKGRRKHSEYSSRSTPHATNPKHSTKPAHRTLWASGGRTLPFLQHHLRLRRTNIGHASAACMHGSLSASASIGGGGGLSMDRWSDAFVGGII